MIQQISPPTNANNETVTLLRKTRVFENAPETLLRSIASHCEVRSFETDGVLARPGAPQTHVVFILEGEVGFLRKAPDGTELLVAILERPMFFGDVELLAHDQSMSCVRAMSPTTAILVPGAAFERAVAMDHEIGLTAYRESAAREMLIAHNLHFTSFESKKTQLLRLLWDFAQPPKRPGEVAVAPLSRVRFARALGVDRKTITRNLKRLEAAGLIEVRGREAALLVDRRQMNRGPKARKAYGASWRYSVNERSRPADQQEHETVAV